MAVSRQFLVRHRREGCDRGRLHHFGEGIVSTPEDFGAIGSPPSHPELLDWLAREFVESGWSIKRLHRLILTSSVYRQRSTIDQSAHQLACDVDPDNRLLWRQNPLRLDADAYRDSVLAVSGRIDFAMGGPAIQHFNQSPGPQLTPKLDYAPYDWSSPGAGLAAFIVACGEGSPIP